MRTWAPRFSFALLAVLLAAIVASGAGAPRGPVKEPRKLVIISTTDVKGRTNPCG